MVTMDYTKIFEAFITEFKELNNTLKCIESSLDCIGTDLGNIATTISAGNSHSVAEEILEARYQIKDAIMNLSGHLGETLFSLKNTDS